MKEIRLSDSRRCANKGLYVALVDDVDYEWASGYRWSANVLTNGSARQVYASRIDDDRRRRHTHREIAERAFGPFQLGTEVDHIEPGEYRGLDNRRSNLRIATRSRNMANVGRPISNRSGFKGVWWDQTRQLWAAKIKVNYRAIHLGRYLTALEAARAYDLAAVRHFGEFARQNLPAVGSV